MLFISEADQAGMLVGWSSSKGAIDGISFKDIDLIAGAWQCDSATVKRLSAVNITPPGLLSACKATALKPALKTNDLAAAPWPLKQLPMALGGQAVKVSTPVPRGGRVHNVTFQRIEVARAGMILAATDIVGPLPKSRAEAPQVSGITFRSIFVHNISCVPGALANVTVRNVTGLAGDPAKPLTWDCSEPGTVFGDAVDVTTPLTCLGKRALKTNDLACYAQPALALVVAALLSHGVTPALALDNGASNTPPMGWNSWVLIFIYSWC